MFVQAGILISWYECLHYIYPQPQLFTQMHTNTIYKPTTSREVVSNGYILKFVVNFECECVRVRNLIFGVGLELVLATPENTRTCSCHTSNTRSCSCLTGSSGLATSDLLETPHQILSLCTTLQNLTSGLVQFVT